MDQPLGEAEQPAKQPVLGDLVSQIQTSLTGLCELFFHQAGSLQRDAQLASVAGEPVEPEASKPARANIPQMAQELVAASKQVDSLLARLPALELNEQRQLEEVAQLMVGAYEQVLQLASAQCAC